MSTHPSAEQYAGGVHACFTPALLHSLARRKYSKMPAVKVQEALHSRTREQLAAQQDLLPCYCCCIRTAAQHDSPSSCAGREKRQMMLLNRRPSRLPTRLVNTLPESFSFRVFSLHRFTDVTVCGLRGTSAKEWECHNEGTPARDTDKQGYVCMGGMHAGPRHVQHL